MYTAITQPGGSGFYAAKLLNLYNQDPALITPALLQRSGVGPSGLLDDLGIAVVSDLPVGDNLADHCVVPLLAEPREGAWRKEHFSLQAAWRFSTAAQPGSLDAQLLMFSYLNVRTTGEGSATARAQGGL